jgi:hypothetical protein
MLSRLGSGTKIMKTLLVTSMVALLLVIGCMPPAVASISKPFPPRGAYEADNGQAWMLVWGGRKVLQVRGFDGESSWAGVCKEADSFDVWECHSEVHATDGSVRIMRSTLAGSAAQDLSEEWRAEGGGETRSGQTRWIFLKRSQEEPPTR